jgi:hypothetical protein
MNSSKALFAAGKSITEGATLDELREAARDLRALAHDSVLADLVESKIEAIENDRRQRER